MINHLDQVVEKALNEWLEWMKDEKQYSKNTITSYLIDIKLFLAFLHKHHSCDITLNLIEQVTITDIRSWLFDLKLDNHTTRSTSRYLSAIRNFYKYLKKFHNISNNNALNINIRNVKKTLPKAVSFEETRNIINEVLSLSDPLWIQLRDYALINLIYGCGLRISEALSITKNDLGGEFLNITGKGKKQRSIPILPEIKTSIQKYLNNCLYSIKSNEAIFVGEQGKKLNPSVFQKKIRIIRTNLGLPDTVTPHAFRHSFASHLLENGADLRSIQELLGHENLSTTQIYTAINKNRIMDVYLKTHPRK
jgi:integrase/recombinase XerC